MDLEKILNFPTASGPVVKYFNSDHPSLTEFVRREFASIIAIVDNKDLNQEIQYLQSIHRKYKNAQRHFIYYRKLSMVRRKTKRLLSSSQVGILRSAAEKHWKLSEADGHLIPSRQMFDHALVAWIQLAFDVHILQKISVNCYIYCRRQMALGHFAKECFTFMCMISRISCFLRKMSEILTGSYKSLLHARSLIPALKTSWLLDDLKIPIDLDFERFSEEKMYMIINGSESCLEVDEASVEDIHDVRPSSSALPDLLWSNTELVGAGEGQTESTGADKASTGDSGKRLTENRSLDPNRIGGLLHNDIKMKQQKSHESFVKKNKKKKQQLSNLLANEEAIKEVISVTQSESRDRELEQRNLHLKKKKKKKKSSHSTGTARNVAECFDPDINGYNETEEAVAVDVSPSKKKKKKKKKRKGESFIESPPQDQKAEVVEEVNLQSNLDAVISENEMRSPKKKKRKKDESFIESFPVDQEADEMENVDMNSPKRKKKKKRRKKENVFIESLPVDQEAEVEELDLKSKLDVKSTKKKKKEADSFSESFPADQEADEMEKVDDKSRKKKKKKERDPLIESLPLPDDQKTELMEDVDLNVNVMEETKKKKRKRKRNSFIESLPEEQDANLVEETDMKSNFNSNNKKRKKKKKI